MKQLCHLLLILFVVTQCSKADVRYVIAASGLNLRMSPSPTTASVKLLVPGSAVTVIEEQKDVSSWQGLQGHWTRASFENTEGWAFGAFLSKDKPPRATGTWTDCGAGRGYETTTFSADGGYRFIAGTMGFISTGSFKETANTVTITSRSVSVSGRDDPWSTMTYEFQADGRLCASNATCLCRP